MPVLESYIGKAFSCACGRVHDVPIKRIEIGDGALLALKSFLNDLDIKSVIILDDEHTGPVLGDDVWAILNGEKFKLSHTRFTETGDHLKADQQAIDLAQAQIRECVADLVIVVGSGTLTDIARYASYLEGIPFISLPTAPSVDGYASGVAALQLDGMKVTKEAHAPIGIFALPQVLAKAPAVLIQAGFGDLLGKTTSLMDWKLASFLYGEYWCDAAYRLVNEPLQYCVKHAGSLLARDPAVIRALFEGLLSSGISMAMVGSSQPASGAEHHCSHYWDFLAYQGVRSYTSHGLQVGYATHWVLRLYQKLYSLKTIRRPMLPVQNLLWEHDLGNRWGHGAENIKQEQNKKSAWLTANYRADRWVNLDMHSLLSALQPEIFYFEETAQALRIMGITENPDDIGVNPDLLLDTLLHAHQLRARYTIFDFWLGQGSLDEVVRQVIVDNKLGSSRSVTES